jgi:hypothetical protein
MKGLDSMPTKEALGWKIAQSVTALLLTISLGLSTWTLNAVVDLREQVAVGRSARLALERNCEAFAREITRLQLSVAGLPQESPPKWWKAQVDDSFSRMVETLSKMESKLDANAAKLNDIETGLKMHVAAQGGGKQ